MANPGLSTLPKGVIGLLERRLTDLGRVTGLLLDRIKTGPAAGRWITARPAVGLWTQLNSYTDLLMTPGVEVRVLDVPTAVVSARKQKLGSAWRVGDPVDGTDPPQGLLEPMGPICLGRNYAPVVLAASAAYQTASLNTAVPLQVGLPAGILNSTRRRIIVDVLVTKAGATDTLGIGLFLGVNGSFTDNTLFNSTVLTSPPVAATLQVTLSIEISYIDATHVRVRLRNAPILDTTAFSGSSVTLTNSLATNLQYLTLGVRTGTTDAPTVQDWQVTFS